MTLSPKTITAIVDYTMITLGSLILAIGVALFMIDANIIPGGVTGLSMALNYITGISVGKLIILLNIPLFIWGIAELGSTFGIRTFYGFVSNSIFIDLLRGDIYGLEFIRLQDTAPIVYLLHNDFLFLILIGGTLSGIGLGLVFKFNGTTAGTEIVCAIFKKRFGIQPGKSMIAVDMAVILVAAVIIHVKSVSDKPTIVLMFYAIISLYVAAVIIDRIIYGLDYAKSVQIFSSKNDEISSHIMKDLNRGVTALYGKGLYRNVDREMLFTVVSSNEARELTQWVKGVDPSAFVVLSNVHEIVGEGFRRREEVDLTFLKKGETQAAQAYKDALIAEAAASAARNDALEAQKYARELSSDSPRSERLAAESKAQIAMEAAQLAHSDALKARRFAQELENRLTSEEHAVPSPTDPSSTDK